MARGISVVSQLLSYVNYGETQGVDGEIAKAILENYDLIPQLTIYELADLCFVSASSITRFIRNIGYDSYKLFKNEVETTLKIDVDYSKKINLATSEDLQPIFQRFTDHILENIRFTYQNINYEQLHRVCEMIYQANQIAFFGLEYANQVGFHFQNKMASLNKIIRIGVTDEKQLALAQELNVGSLVFVVSLEGSYFYRHNEIFDLLVKKKCQIVAISMMTSGKFVNYCDEVILCGKTNSDTEGRVSLMYMIELIIMAYYINFSHE